MSMNPIANLRENYTFGELTEADAGTDPLRLFDRWFQDASAAGIREVNAMTLATVDGDGAPAARIVLLKGVDEGFVFFTNYGSAKGQELTAHPRAALCFHWKELERQVRIQGRAERISAAESDEYFRTRPRGSQIGAWASKQSAIAAGRDEIEQEYRDREAGFAGQDIPLPPFWGGFRLRPAVIEFWQGRPSRLHDRLRYTRTADGWLRDRLWP